MDNLITGSDVALFVGVHGLFLGLLAFRGLVRRWWGA